MKTITSRGTGDPAGDVRVAAERLVLSGPPTALRGVLSLQNSAAERTFVRDLPLGRASGKRSSDLDVIGTDHLLVRARLAGGESRDHEVVCALSPQTPPGSYEAVASLGEQTIPVRMVVHPVVDFTLGSDRLYFVGAEPGRTHTAEVLFVNRGNVPLEVPSLRHGTTMDVDLICRNLSKAVRGQGTEGVEAVLDEAVRKISEEMAGWVKITIGNAGALVQPGAWVLIQLSLTLPDDINRKRSHEGEIRIYDETLGYLIVPGTSGAEKAAS